MSMHITRRVDHFQFHSQKDKSEQRERHFKL